MKSCHIPITTLGFVLALAAPRVASGQSAPARGARPDPRAKAIADVVAANHILADRGVVDGYGHVSVRDPTDPSRFLLARSMAPELVTAADVLVHDLDGKAEAPPDTKLYPSGLPNIALPRDWTVPPLAATEVLGGMSTTATPVALQGLGRLLRLSAGVVRFRARRPSPAGVWRFRAAGSAGGRFPLEVYVAAHGVEGLEDGVYWYDPVAHALVRIAPPPLGDDLATTVVVTGVAWRTAWRYTERGFRHVYWDAGSMLGQLLALAHSAGWQPRLYTRFPMSASPLWSAPTASRNSGRARHTRRRWSRPRPGRRAGTGIDRRRPNRVPAGHADPAGRRRTRPRRPLAVGAG